MGIRPSTTADIVVAQDGTGTDTGDTGDTGADTTMVGITTVVGRVSSALSARTGMPRA
jgi:hypothetical protein